MWTVFRVPRVYSAVQGCRLDVAPTGFLWLAELAGSCRCMDCVLPTPPAHLLGIILQVHRAILPIPQHTCQTSFPVALAQHLGQMFLSPESSALDPPWRLRNSCPLFVPEAGFVRSA